jgi:hypothetical protein
MGKYELTLLVRDSNDETKFQSKDTVVSNDMVHLLSQFLLVVARVLKFERDRDVTEAKYALSDDDIPF